MFASFVHAYLSSSRNWSLSAANSCVMVRSSGSILKKRSTLYIHISMSFLFLYIALVSIGGSCLGSQFSSGVSSRSMKNLLSSLVLRLPSRLIRKQFNKCIVVYTIVQFIQSINLPAVETSTLFPKCQIRDFYYTKWETCTLFLVLKITNLPYSPNDPQSNQIEP